MSDNEQGNKFDNNKLRFDLIVPTFEEELAKVLTYGANKYGPNNWRNVPDALNRYYAALQRHLNSFWQAEEFDKESGLPHLAHAAANIMFLMEFKRMQHIDEKYPTYEEEK